MEGFIITSLIGVAAFSTFFTLGLVSYLFSEEAKCQRQHNVYDCELFWEYRPAVRPAEGEK